VRVDAFDFDLPGDAIALRPAEPRDSARLLAVNPANDSWRDHLFSELPDLLAPGDLLVFNDTKVIPARLNGVRTGRGETTPKIEATLHRRLDQHRWWAFAKPARKLSEADMISFGAPGETCFAGSLMASVERKGDGGEILLSFELSGAVLDDAIAAHGVMPLPPYIASKRAPDARDIDDYQTIFAAQNGAVAAPTAGLHFTPAILERVERKGVDRTAVTLHVGAGTFLPVKAETTEQHRMHAEWGTLSEEAAGKIQAAREAGSRIVCIGTTSLRLLESAIGADGKMAAYSGETDIFITPGHEFRSADILLTNFHLPRSTLFMLVCAFAGTDLMKAAYRHAVEAGYRFYSYGDACVLTLRQE
jgi:S-adenosylmethionine:tRNA ribosyltransferase-isomerase